MWNIFMKLNGNFFKNDQQLDKKKKKKEITFVTIGKKCKIQWYRKKETWKVEKKKESNIIQILGDFSRKKKN